MEDLDNDGIVRQWGTAEVRGRLIHKLRRRLRTLDGGARDVPGRAPAGSLPAGDESQAESLWNGLLLHTAAAGHEGTALADDAQTLDQLESVTLALLDAFPPFRRGILVSLLVGLMIPQTAELHLCTQRTVHKTLQIALEMLGKPRTA